ncbi:MAG: RND transporter [Burkholderiales bacterium 28-67-8]|nr:MAG: RND transporter [Burkholderiales bacterium 28-67-8]
MRLALSALASLLLTGCASFSADGGFGAVQQLTHERTGHSPTHPPTPKQGELAQARLAELLKLPLSADSAVEIAFLSNRALQANFAELGIAESDLVRAGRLSNPSIRVGRLSGGGGAEIDRAVMFDVLGLLTMPAARAIEQRRFEQTQLRAAQAAVGLAAEARRAFFSAVAAQQLAGYAAQVKDAADASSELARRMAQAGNFSALTQMREQSFQVDATLQFQRATQQAVAERERLIRALGLSSDSPGFTLPERLPDLPRAPAQPQDAEQTAMNKRLDVLIARRDTEATAQSLGLTRATRFINALHVGYQNQSTTGEARRDGYEIELELPLFDFGTARVARAEAIYMQSVHRTAQVALSARSEVRESYSAYRTAHEVARVYRDDVVPLRKRISEQNLLRYNAMLSSAFELLTDAREQIAGVTGAVETLRDYWIAETDLQSALTGGSPPASKGASLPYSSVGPTRAAH